MHIPMFIFGLVFAGAGVVVWLKARKLAQSCTAAADGTVTGYETKRTGAGRSGRSHYYPAISYSVNGAEYTIRGTMGSLKPKYPEGTAIQVLYNPAAPEKSYLANERTSNTIAGPFIFLVGIALLIGSFFY